MEEKRFNFEVGLSDEGKRLDKYLVDNMPKEYSRTYIQKLIASAGALLNGAPAARHHKVKRSDAVEVILPPAAESYIEAEDIPLDIVYEDDDIIIVNKKAGMVTHPAPGNFKGTLVNALLAHCNKKLSGVGGVMRPGMVHRLDKDTSGLLAVAKTDRAHASLARQLKNKTAARIYLAVVKGNVELDNGTVELPIGRSPKDRKKMAVNFEDSKDAHTSYRVIERFGPATLLELRLGTGRTHQIRVHMSYIGHPVLGDGKYGHRSEHIDRPALHAKVLGFVHPVTNRYVEFSAEPPDDMIKLMEKLRGAKNVKKGGRER